MNNPIEYFDQEGEDISDCVVFDTHHYVYIEGPSGYIKLPLHRPHQDEGELRAHRESLEHERAILSRINGCNAVIRCYSLHGPGIEVEIGESILTSFLAETGDDLVLASWQLFWFRQLAVGLAQMHDRRVLLTSLDTDYVIMMAYPSNIIKFFNFRRAILLAPETPRTHLIDPDTGYSFALDLLQLGVLFYQIATCTFIDVEAVRFDENGRSITSIQWPLRSELPETTDIWIGEIIEKCFTGEYSSAWEVLEDLEEYRADDTEYFVFGEEDPRMAYASPLQSPD
jgi:hypothetical protein